MSNHQPAVRSMIHGLAFIGVFAVATVAAAADAPSMAKKPAPATASGKAARPATAAAAKKSVVKPVETGPAEATAEQIAAAERVYYGAYECEFKQTLDIDKNMKHTAYVDVKSGKSMWTMKPVVSSTGAIRLEDVKGETLMVQISSKSMLLNVKTARRIVDDCISAKQRELIEAEKMAKASGTSPAGVSLGISAGSQATDAASAATVAANGNGPAAAASSAK